MIKRWLKKRSQSTSKPQCEQPNIISRSNHSITRKHISHNALKVMYRLHKAGYAGYLVGGSVRDLLLGGQPKDFDITTDARPEQILKLFRNARMIGRRFRIVHIYFHQEVIEVATFRANSQEDKDANTQNTEDMPVLLRDDNTYGTIEEDAWRRDFTVNALYYNISDYSVVDFTGGMQDLQDRTLRMIGDPLQRYHEDPVRLLRAIRHAAKHDLHIEENTEKPIAGHAHLLQHVPPARLLDEVLKLFFTGHALQTFHKLRKYHYMRVLFPACHSAIEAGVPHAQQIIEHAMQITDQRYQSGQTLNPGFLLSVILWPALQQRLSVYQDDPRQFYKVMHATIHDVVAEQAQRVMIPRRMAAMIRSIWVLQYHLQRRRPSRAARLLRHRYYRAAIDFFELRVEAGEPHHQLAKWWRQFQHAKPNERQKLLSKIANSKRKK